MFPDFIKVPYTTGINSYYINRALVKGFVHDGANNIVRIEYSDGSMPLAYQFSNGDEAATLIQLLLHGVSNEV